MTILFNTTFEDNHLYKYPVTNGFHGVYVDGGTIEVTTQSKNKGYYGCEISPIQYYKACGLQYTEPLTNFRQRFYFNVDNLVLTVNQSMFISRNHHSDASRILYAIALKYTSSQKVLYFAMSDNSETLTAFSGEVPLLSGWNYVESYWQSGSPGSFQVWLNGTSRGTIVQTNNLKRVTYPALGVSHYYTSPISGKLYIDDWTANDNGAPIGS